MQRCGARLTPPCGLGIGRSRLPNGLSVLGTPFGSDAYVQQRLALKREEHERLLQRIPFVQDLQAAWLLLHYCAAPCANYLLRSLPPATTAAYVPRMTQP